jgi:UDP-N-acetylglucosamine 2-epimerase
MQNNKTTQPVKIAFIIGTRPEVIRIAPIVKEVHARSSEMECVLIHTGQHYSPNMREELIADLNIQVKVDFIELAERIPYLQLGEMIAKTGKLLENIKPSMVCVWGDTNSSLAGALAANKLQLPLCHIESGCRSYDRRMPEEHNRILIDVISDLLMPLSFNDKKNLEDEKIKGQISWVGDPLFDVFKQEVTGLKSEYKINAERPYCLVTLHRAENVDNKQTLTRIFNALNQINDYDVIFPIHPRTLKMATDYNLLDNLKANPRVKIKEPLSYHELLGFLLSSSFVITDSGGVQKEAYYAQKPCITVRKSTEWVDTQRLGVNIVIDPELKDFENKMGTTINSIKEIEKIFAIIQEKPYGDGSSSKLITNLLLEYNNN